MSLYNYIYSSRFNSIQPNLKNLQLRLVTYTVICQGNIITDRSGVIGARQGLQVMFHFQIR